MGAFNPLGLLWLLPMAGLIVAMYILKLRRRDVVVSSTWLWRQVIRDVQANAPFQKLRKSLLLFMQLAAVALLVLAVARPYARSTGLGGRSVVIVVDTSASMAATDVGRSRLDEAKREAYQVIGDMRPEDQMMVLSAAARPEAVTGFSGDHADLSRAVDALKVHETTTNMRDAVALAAAMVASRESSQIDIISDGAFPPVTNVNLGHSHVVFHRVGKACHNVGITAVDYRRSLAGENTVQVFVTVHNFDTKSRTLNVVLTHDGDPVDAHEVSLAPGAENPDVFDVPEPAQPFTLKVSLEVKDDLAADNQAALLILPRRTIRTLLVSEGNPFLETAIKVDPSVELTVAKPGPTTRPAGYDAVILDGQAPKGLPEGNYYYVSCGGNQSPAALGPESEGQGIIDPNRSHPLLRYVDFGTTQWTTMHRGVLTGWGQELASSETGPAIVAGEKNRMRAVWTGFGLDLGHGAFPLTVSYPIFISNVIRWLAHADDTAASQVRTGAPITLDAPPAAGRVTVTKPDGASRDVPVATRGGAVFDDTDEVGIYRAAGKDYQRSFAANLADYTESDITPRPAPELVLNLPGRPGHPVPVTRELWPWVALFLLGLLAAEWWVFHRRVYVS